MFVKPLAQFNAPLRYRHGKSRSEMEMELKLELKSLSEK